MCQPSDAQLSVTYTQRSPVCTARPAAATKLFTTEAQRKQSDRKATVELASTEPVIGRNKLFTTETQRGLAALGRNQRLGGRRSCGADLRNRTDLRFGSAGASPSQLTAA